MKIARGFHSRFPTSVNWEIVLADMLHTGLCMRFGIHKLGKMLRTDPAAVIGRMAYCRFQMTEKNYWHTAPGVLAEPQTRAKNSEILTPSHAEWDEFQERLEAEIACPDFDHYYGASQVVHHDSIETEYWPLCSASLIADMGFAVAESLTVWRSFLGEDDRQIAKHVGSFWKKTKPSKRRPAFDAGPTVSVSIEERTGHADCRN